MERTNLKKVFKIRGQRRYYGFCCLLVFATVLATMHLGQIFVGGVSILELVIFDCLFAAYTVVVILESFVLRLVSDEHGIQIFDMLNRRQSAIPYEKITSYRPGTRRGWILQSGDEVVRTNKFEKQVIHSMIAEMAPDALTAKLWKCGQLPPSEDFSGLNLFDWNLWLTYTVGAAFISGLISFLSWGYGIGYLVSSLVQTSYHLKDLLGSLEINTDGVIQTYPWSRTSILWTELTAVYCERRHDQLSYFIVTAPGRAITVPAHVLANPEVRRKFFYSIPDRTKCINFDQLRFKRRGRGKGKKMWIEEPMGSLEPSLAI